MEWSTAKSSDCKKKIINNDAKTFYAQKSWQTNIPSEKSLKMSYLHGKISSHPFVLTAKCPRSKFTWVKCPAEKVPTPHIWSKNDFDLLRYKHESTFKILVHKWSWSCGFSTHMSHVWLLRKWAIYLKTLSKKYLFTAKALTFILTTHVSKISFLSNWLRSEVSHQSMWQFTTSITYMQNRSGSGARDTRPVTCHRATYRT